MRTRTPRARMRAGARTVCRLSFNARKKRSAPVSLEPACVQLGGQMGRHVGAALDSLRAQLGRHERR